MSETEQQLEAAAALLREHGYNVAPPRVRSERVSEFMRRVGLKHYQQWSRLVRRWLDHGGSLLVTRRNVSGDIMELVSNDAFDAFCRGERRLL